MNKQNFRCSASENHRAIHDRPVSSAKADVWCAIGSRGVPPYPCYWWRGSSNCECRTIDANVYRLSYPRVWLTSDWCGELVASIRWGRSPPSSLQHGNASQVMLWCIVSRFGDVSWAPKSDFTAPNFFLWGYLKEKAYSNRFQDIEELKTRIRLEVCNVMKDIRRGVTATATDCSSALKIVVFSWWTWFLKNYFLLLSFQWCNNVEFFKYMLYSFDVLVFHF